MSGIYIPGMKMPTSCAECRFYGEYCYAKGDENKRSKLPCPLVPVPEHGRLVDADALIAWFEEWYDPNADLEICHVKDILDDNSVAPTIVPADKEAEA